jgi:hypothetical protein
MYFLSNGKGNPHYNRSLLLDSGHFDFRTRVQERTVYERRGLPLSCYNQSEQSTEHTPPPPKYLCVFPQPNQDISYSSAAVVPLLGQ